MVYHIGINDIEPHHWVAWVFDWHGCFAKGKTRDEVVTLLPDAIKEYFAWRRRYDSLFKVSETNITISIDEEIYSYPVADYFVNALFEHDRLPLTAMDIHEIEKILSFSRSDLNSLLSSIDSYRLEKTIPGEVTGSIGGVVRHIATAEIWYLDRIGITFPRERRPSVLHDLLSVSREQTLNNLQSLEGRTEAYVKRSELWTARKVIRRTLWHEIAHTRQIIRYITEN